MTSEEFFIDLGIEVINFAHEQGHTKASKNTINWKDLKSASGAAKFTTTSKTTKTKTLKIPDQESRIVFDYIDAYVENQTTTHICEAGKSSTKISNCNVTNGSPVIKFKQNYLMNKLHQPVVCSLIINHSLKNMATANAKFTGTLSCLSEDKTKPKGKIEGQNKTKLKASLEVDELLKQVPLSPKFSTKLSPTATKRQKIPYQVRTKLNKAITLPAESESKVEIIEHNEEERGNFKVDYYLWGSVEVTVWGKPYTLMVSDILDTKHNPLFARETLLLGNDKTSVPASKIVLHGSYECNQKYFEIDTKPPIPVGLSSPKNGITLYPSHKTENLPKLEADQVAALDDKNLAKLLFRWKDGLDPKQKRKSDSTEQLWSLLLHHKTSIFARIAQEAQIEQICKTSNAFDKLTLTLLLWREDCITLSELESRKSWSTLELRKKSIDIIEKLHDIGIPVSIMKFLWTEDGSKALSVQNGSNLSSSLMKTKTPRLQDLHKRAQIKMQASLPDRVLNRLIQRWPHEDGWIAAALYFDVDMNNLLSLACNSLSATTIEEKRMTVLKLWRIKQRRKADGLCKECTIWDLCIQLNDLGLTTPIYSFLWKDSETTP